MMHPSGIRAPITVDESDSEYSVSSSHCGGSEMQSDVFLSGEDENGIVIHKDEEVLEQTHFLEEYEFSKPIVIVPNGDIGQERDLFRQPSVKSLDKAISQGSYSTTGSEIFRLRVRDVDERVRRGMGDGFDSDGSTILFSDSEDELVEDNVLKICNRRLLATIADEEVSEKERKSVGRIRIPVSQKLQVPIARISYDTDDGGSQSSGDLDDDGGSLFARVPSHEVMHRLNGAPRVKTWEPEEENVCESATENSEGADFHEDRLSNDVFSSLETIASAQNLMLINTDVEVLKNIDVSRSCEEDLDLDKHRDNACDGFSGKICSSHSTGEVKSLYGTVEQMEPTELSSNSCLETVSMYGGDIQAGNTGLQNDLSSNEDVESEKLETASEQVLDKTSGDVNVDHIQSSNDGLEDNLFCNGYIESEKLETACEQESDQASRAVNDNGIQICNTVLEDNLIFKESFDSEEKLKVACERASPQTGDIERVRDECYLDTPSDIEQIPMSVSHLKDSSLTGRSDTCHCTTLDQEIRRDTENSELPTVVDASAFHTGITSVIAENEREQDSALLSCGDILLDESQKMSQIVTESNAGVGPDCEIDGCSEILDFVCVNEVEDFPLERSFADPGSIDRSIKAVDEARSVELLVSPLSDDESVKASSVEETKKLEKIHQLSAKYMSLLKAVAHSPENDVASKALCQRKFSGERFFSEASPHLGSDRTAAIELETKTRNNSGFSLCILVIGKTGVGKSATMNSIFGESKVTIDPFEPATDHVTEITGIIDGVELRIFDTPGLRYSLLDQTFNRKVLSSIRQVMRKHTPDVILYVDRLDMQNGYLNDLPLLKLVVSYLGSDIWEKTVVALTHAASGPPDGPNGYPLSHEAFVAQRSWDLQQLINLSSGNPGLMVPVCLIENNQFARKNGCKEAPLPNMERWRSHLLLLCGSIQTLSQLKCLLGIENPIPINKKPSGLRVDSPLLSRLSLLLQNNIHPGGDLFNSGTEMVGASHCDQGVDENLPDIKPLMKSHCRENWDLSVVRFGGELRDGWCMPAIGKIFQISICATLKDHLRGHISLKTHHHHSDQLQLAALALLSMAITIFKGRRISQ